MAHNYALAPNGVFSTVQGEGPMMGTPMHFVRLAGCSVGCPGCDTDYKVAERLTLAEIVERLQRLPRREWVWLTGGEPTDQPLGELVESLRREEYRVALVTSGVRKVTRDGWRIEVDFLSVSPHFSDDRWQLEFGNQLNLVAGLNGLELAALKSNPKLSPHRWGSRWVTPAWASSRATAECLEWVIENPDWRLGVQAHKVWGIN